MVPWTAASIRWAISGHRWLMAVDGGEDNKTWLIMLRPTGEGGPRALSGNSGADRSG